MYACAESFWTIFFELLKYSIDNFIFVIIALAAVYSFGRKFGSTILGFLAATVDFIVDSQLITFAGATTFISVIGGIVIGMIWALMMLTAKEVPALVRIPNAVIMFFIGTIIGIIPFHFLALIPITIGILLSAFPQIGYILGIIMAVGLYFIMSIASPIVTKLCEWFNYILSLF